jgi:hypothetical protein
MSQEDLYQEKKQGGSTPEEQPGSPEQKSAQRHDAKDAKGKKKTND